MSKKQVLTNELKWQAESDASTMARYQEIISDKARMNRAIKEANRQARGLSSRAAAMKSVASTKGTAKPSQRKK